jgi:hypothetical protein
MTEEQHALVGELLDNCPVKVNSLKIRIPSSLGILKEGMLTPSSNSMINQCGFSQNLGILLTRIFNPMHCHADEIHGVISSIFLSN